MALADLRARARARMAVRVQDLGVPRVPAAAGSAVAGVKTEEIRGVQLGEAPGTPGTRASQARGSGLGRAQTEEICGFQGGGTPRTPGTPKNDDVWRIEDSEAAILEADAGAAEGQATTAPPLPPADLVERLAVAMAAPRPWQRVEGDPAPALAYFRSEARRRLDTLAGNPMAQGLLVSAEEAAARRYAAKGGGND